PITDQVTRAYALVERSPAEPSLRLRLVERLLEAGRVDEAATEVGMLAALAPDAPTTRYAEARVLVARGEPDEAMRALDALLATTFDASAASLRGELREEAGDFDGALVDYEAALAVAPSIDLFLGRARMLERRGEPLLAQRGLEEGIEASGGSIVLRDHAVALARRSGRYDDALALIEPVVARTPSATYWRVLRAAVLADLGRAREARRELDQALALADAQVARRGSPLALQERARVLVELGRLDDARHDLTRALARAPSLIDARRLLAMAGGAR
ncbi:MAG: tetratricopeptide repeat protein, partial [Sandaracinaceae bacterium]